MSTCPIVNTWRFAFALLCSCKNFLTAYVQRSITYATHLGPHARANLLDFTQAWQICRVPMIAPTNRLPLGPGLGTRISSQIIDGVKPCVPQCPQAEELLTAKPDHQEQI